MRFTRVLAIAILAGTIGASMEPTQVSAQIREQQPAEFPPDSYKGKQYVDSAGCVFIRAGIDGDVAWVPRVTRARKVVCGFKPSLNTVAAAPAPVESPARVVAQSAPAVAPPPRAVPRRVTPAATAVRPRVVAAPRAPVVVEQQSAVSAYVDSACPSASQLSQQYLRKGRLPVRCGPQTAPIGAARATTGVATTSVAMNSIIALPETFTVDRVITETTRIVPRGVAVRRLNTQNAVVPKGYKSVWTDGRLNPRRAEQNLRGIAEMSLVWTNTLPRRLINQKNGQDLTARLPLVYPYTSITQQRAELGEVKIVRLDGTLVKRIDRNAVSGSVTRAPVISTRSAPKSEVAKPRARAQTTATGDALYVQIGTYRKADTAQRAAQQVARMGLPARIGKHRKGFKTYMTVQAGPFTQGNRLQKAVRKLRKAGYKDAFVRK